MWIAGVLLLVLLFVTARLALDRGLRRPQGAPRPIAARGDLASDEQSTIELFETASPAVVYVSPLQRRVDYFTLNVFEVPAGTGSGFIWDAQGHVVTGCDPYF